MQLSTCSLRLGLPEGRAVSPLTLGLPEAGLCPLRLGLPEAEAVLPSGDILTIV